MSEEKENLDIGLKKVFDSFFALKHFCMPAVVTAFDANLQTVSVQPALMTLAQDSTVPEMHPIIEDVPVVFPGGGGFFLTFDILPGSYVLLVFAERSIENWADLGGIADPQSTRKCDLSDAIAIPGLLPTPNVLVPGVDSLAATLRNKLGTSYVKVTDAAVEINGNTDYAVAYNDLKLAFDQLKSDFNNFVTTVYNLHNHPTAPVGPVSPPSVPGTSSAADMSAAQVPTVKLP
jgi:hypothetical protein